MGLLAYGSNRELEIDDRVLAHLELAITPKLRRGESFGFTWVPRGGAPTAVWLSPGIPLTYIYFGSREPGINRAWVSLLARSANSATGLHVMPEPSNPDA